MFNEYAKSGFTDDSGFDMSTHLVTAQGVASGIIGFLYSGLGYGPRVRVYTTWDNDNASRGVSIEDASQFQ